MSKVIVITNHKGGVGKTTTATNLGAALALEGKRVLLIDNDPQGNLSAGLGIDIDHLSASMYDVYCRNGDLPVHRISEQLDIAPANLELAGAERELLGKPYCYSRLKKTVTAISSKYDYIIIDCPPSLGVLTTNAMLTADSMLIAVQPEYYSRKGLDSIMTFFDEVRQELNEKLEVLGMLFTQVKNTAAIKSIMEDIENTYGKRGYRVFKTHIRQNSALHEAAIMHKDIFAYNKRSHGAEDYKAFCQEILS